MQVGTQSKDKSTGAAPERSANGTLVTRRQFPVSKEKEDTLKCSGKSCRSCSGVLLADCIALSCCPCAVVNVLALACLKVPWVVGRKCLRALADRSKVRDGKGREKGEGMEMMIGVKSLEKRGREEEEVSAVLSNCIGEGEGGLKFEGELAWLELDRLRSGVSVEFLSQEFPRRSPDQGNIVFKQCSSDLHYPFSSLQFPTMDPP